MNKFLRTASLRRLLATIAGIVAVIVGGTAIALAATSGGPLPKRERLAVAIRHALAAKPIEGISAGINFTNNLIDTSEIQGSDPLLMGGSGQLWASGDGRLRIELFGSNGDPEIVVNHASWWIYDPTLNTVYEGKLPTGGSAAGGSTKREALPTVAEIQTDLGRLAAHLKLSGAIPTNVGGRPAYTVKVSPQHGGGLLGQLQLAWDAYRGVPLRFAVYARGSSTPVLQVAATGVSYGTISPGTFDIPIPSGQHVVNVAMPAPSASSGEAKATGKGARKHAEISGVAAVARRLQFKLAAPSNLAGFARQSVSVLGAGAQRGALVTYGQGLGGIAVIEEPATAGNSQKLNLSTGSGDGASGITLPTVTIHGATGQELDTALGTIIRFTSGNVTYTVLGSVRPSVARRAARGL